MGVSRRVLKKVNREKRKSNEGVDRERQSHSPPSVSIKAFLACESAYLSATTSTQRSTLRERALY